MSDEVKTVEGSRNTNSKTSSRKYAWCFTLNNYTKKDIETIREMSGTVIMQEEKGENGTPHLQGVIRFKDAKSFTSMRKLGNDLSQMWHIEPCKNWHASINYCTKEATRVGETIVRHNKRFDPADYENRWKMEADIMYWLERVREYERELEPYYEAEADRKFWADDSDSELPESDDDFPDPPKLIRQ